MIKEENLQNEKISTYFFVSPKKFRFLFYFFYTFFPVTWFLLLKICCKKNQSAHTHTQNENGNRTEHELYVLRCSLHWASGKQCKSESQRMSWECWKVAKTKRKIDNNELRWPTVYRTHARKTTTRMTHEYGWIHTYCNVRYGWI